MSHAQKVTLGAVLALFAGVIVTFLIVTAVAANGADTYEQCVGGEVTVVTVMPEGDLLPKATGKGC